MISAIVINYNGRDYLGDCLDALIEQQPKLDEILVVDNQSEDASRELVLERYPTVTLVDAGGNLGPAAARNRGVAAARNELCLLVDNDVVVQPGCVAALRTALESNPDVALVQARSLCADRPELVHYDHADLHFLGTLVLHNFFQPLQQARQPSGPVGAFVALCLLTRASVYHAVGGFRSELFILYEDNELSYKLRMRGHQIVLATDAHCLHRGGTAGLSMRSEHAEYSARRTYLHSRNRWLVVLSCLHWRTLLLTMPAQLGYAAVYLAFACTRGHFWAGVKGHFAALGMLGSVWRWRRELQPLRTVPDRRLLVAMPMTLHPGVAARGVLQRVRVGLDQAFAWYWRVVRSLCG